MSREIVGPHPVRAVQATNFAKVTVMAPAIALQARLSAIPPAGRAPSVGQGSWRRRAILCTLFMAVAIGGFGIFSQRVQLVRMVPVLASIYRAVGLPVNIYQADFESIRATREGEARETRLVVEGQIRNLARGDNVVPDIQIALLDATGKIIFSWIAPLPENRIAPKGSLNFRTSLEAPPPGYHSLVLKFAR